MGFQIRICGPSAHWASVSQDHLLESMMRLGRWQGFFLSHLWATLMDVWESQEGRKKKESGCFLGKTKRKTKAILFTRWRCLLSPTRRGSQGSSLLADPMALDLHAFATIVEEGQQFGSTAVSHLSGAWEKSVLGLQTPHTALCFDDCSCLC